MHLSAQGHFYQCKLPHLTYTAKHAHMFAELIYDTKHNPLSILLLPVRYMYIALEFKRGCHDDEQKRFLE